MFDAVVVGAGHNGLAAAVHLAAKGWKVAVVEREAVPGGAVKTAEATLPGFRHDLGAMNLSLFAGSPFVAAYRVQLVAHGLAFAPAAQCFATAFPDGSHLGVTTDLEATAAGIAALSPADAMAWRRMVAEFGPAAPHIFAILGAPMPSLDTARALWRLWRSGGAAALFDLAKLALSSPRGFLDAHFADPRVKAALAAWGLHLDFAPDVAGGALFPYLEAMANQAFGMALGQGGADTMIRAMTGLLESLGGELHLDSPAEAIETSGGRATGVRVAGGRFIGARQAVIANLNPKLVFGRLLPPGAAGDGYERRVAAFRAGPGTMLVHLALAELPDWSAGPDLRRYAYVHLAPSLDAMARTYSEAMAGLLPAEPVLVVGQPTAVDPSRAPAGRHVLWVQVRVLPAKILGDAEGTISARDWDAAKDPYAERVLDILERYAPGLRQRILGRAVQSPLDLERGNPSLVGGDSLSGSHHLDQYFAFRPVPGWSRYRTPVENLFICGAATWPGAGVGAGSGFTLAKMLAGPPRSSRAGP